ncbi:MAG: TonB-dependent receptor [Melioribacteraceae bacterium]|nr:MAG: TonB-dependent receptor [Melioribacteraceae bacterium]
MEGVFTKFKIFVFVLLFGVTSIFAQSGSGKLAGQITDAATGEPLIGANIIIENTNLGAATDIDGNYFILNITPGTYTVKISYVGYSSKTIQEVRVVAGITYELNETLTSGLNLDEIVVTDKKFFEEKSTNTVKVVDSDQIAKLPVRGVSNIASLQSGVVIQEGSGGVEGNATINVRGGRGSEVLYIVDGVPQNNLITGTTVGSVSNNAIEQLSFQVGGYEAKYGQAQSGIINVTTKGGDPAYKIFMEGITSSFFDDYGYNLYSASISGPIIPGLRDHTIFASIERGWFADADPRAKGWDFASIGETYETTPNNDKGLWRFSARTTHLMGDWKVNLGVVGNMDTDRLVTTAYVKNSSQFFDKTYTDNISFSGRISQTVSSNTFWNLNFGYRMYDFKRVNPFFEDDLLAYGDSTRWANELGVTLLADGQRTPATDEIGIFAPRGRAQGLFQRREQDAITADFDFTSQIDNHLLEFGGGISMNTVRGYGAFAYLAAGQTGTFEEKMAALEPYVFGYDVTGLNHVDDDFAVERQRPRNPFLAYAYVQDRFELEDLVLNLGLRMDYFDVKSYVLVDPTKPYAGGTDPLGFDDGDFKIRDADLEFSPRIGIGFPVTETTVFHAQYGRFIQLPRLLDLYAGPYDYNNYIVMEPQGSFNADLKPEETVQYEIGFRQLLGDNAALNITAFYKNIKGLVNVQNLQFQRSDGGELLNAIVPQNADFGTTKGFAFSFDITRLSYFSVSAQYTFSIAEGTGSSTASSQTAVFRNTDRQAPIVIAPLDFDQRHTGIVNIDFFVPKGELGFFELFNANFLLSFNSGRPYTPLDFFDILSGNNGGPSTTGYVNSRFGPSQFRVDMRLEKAFEFAGIRLSPYLWVQNLFDVDNVTNVWRSTGDPLTTGFLNTETGRAVAQQRGQGYVDDYKALERTPFNFGIPRLIRLGLKINFDTAGL